MEYYLVKPQCKVTPSIALLPSKFWIHCTFPFPVGRPSFPQPDDKPRNVNATDGDSVLMRCNAEGDPQPHIEWYQNGQPLQGTQTAFTVQGHIAW